MSLSHNLHWGEQNPFFCCQIMAPINFADQVPVERDILEWDILSNLSTQMNTGGMYWWQ